LVLILAGVCGPPAWIWVPETYGPKLRGEKRPGLKAFVRTFLVRPIVMLGTEIMVSLPSVVCVV
jgi:hypothetical protein